MEIDFTDGKSQIKFNQIPSGVSLVFFNFPLRSPLAAHQARTHYYYTILYYAILYSVHSPLPRGSMIQTAKRPILYYYYTISCILYLRERLAAPQSRTYYDYR